jgi:hypothetical protein
MQASRAKQFVLAPVRSHGSPPLPLVGSLNMTAWASGARVHLWLSQFHSPQDTPFFLSCTAVPVEYSTTPSPGRELPSYWSPIYPPFYSPSTRRHSTRHHPVTAMHSPPCTRRHALAAMHWPPSTRRHPLAAIS